MATRYSIAVHFIDANFRTNPHASMDYLKYSTWIEIWLYEYNYHDLYTMSQNISQLRK